MELDNRITISFTSFLEIHNRIIESLKHLYENDKYSKQLNVSEKFKEIELFSEQENKSFICLYLDPQFSKRTDRNSVNYYLNDLFEKSKEVMLFQSLFNRVYLSTKENKRKKGRKLSNLGNALIKERLKFFDFRTTLKDRIKTQKSDLDLFEYLSFYSLAYPKKIHLNSQNLNEYIESLNLSINGNSGETLTLNESSVSSKEDKKLSFENDSRGIRYKVFYFSFKKNIVSFYEIIIAYDLMPSYKVEKQDYTVIERGFHDDTELIYNGYAYYLKNKKKLHIVLSNEERNDKFKIILDAGYQVKKEPFMSGAMTAVSADRSTSTLCYEVLFIKASELRQNSELEDDIKNLLFLRRNVFRINPPRDLFSLRYKNAELRMFQSLIGIWQVWRFSEDYKKIYTSALYVRKDLRAYCIINQAKKKIDNIQTCHFDISDNYTICMHVAQYSGSKKISSTYFEELKEQDTLSTGIMVSVGQNKTSPHPYVIVMEEVSHKWLNYFNDDVDIKEVNLEEFKRELPSYNKNQLKIVLNSKNETEKRLFKLLKKKSKSERLHLPEWFNKIESSNKS